ALGKIASAEALQALHKLHAVGGVKGHAAAHALLQSAQELTKQGKTTEAKAILGQLSNPSELRHVRHGASLALKRIG
ncbi:MAG: hypothetical protein ABIF77_10380, partial [bacterium]